MRNKIGILGSGSVGKTLAKGLSEMNVQVMIGSNHPGKLDSIKSDKIATGTFADAAAFGEIIILAVKGTGAIDALKSVSENSLAGKTVIDATNPIAEQPPQNGVLQFFTDINRSLMEDLQQAFPKANFVKALNSIGSGLMIKPQFESKPTMFICGDNEAAKKEAAEIISALGFEAEDMGGKEAARAIEPLCMLWCIPGFQKNMWTNHAFKILKK